MKVIKPGHIYELDHLDGNSTQKLYFVNRNPGQESEGTTNQEVLRALIDRVKFLDNQVPWELNEQIIKHLQMAIALHEARAILRKVEKGKLDIEYVELNPDDQHIRIIYDNQA